MNIACVDPCQVSVVNFPKKVVLQMINKYYLVPKLGLRFGSVNGRGSALKLCEYFNTLNTHLRSVSKFHFYSTKTFILKGLAFLFQN